MSKITSVRLPDDLSEKVDALAASMDRSRAWVIEQALKSYVEEQSWQVQAVQEALAAYRSGKAGTVPHEHVMDNLESRIKTEMAEQGELSS